MSSRPQLKHLGIYVNDIVRMERFYTRVFDLMVTDRGKVARLGNRNIVFMSGAVDAHHQVVLIDGKDPASGPSVLFQISFHLEDLAGLRKVRDMMKEENVADISPISHGNAWSIYASDPEGNGLEAYLDTPWHVAQPHGRPFDLSLPDEQIRAQTESIVRADPTFKMRADWMQSQKLALAD
ncbi:MAG: VOC family protein [Betaproteobacteria bacterium]